MTDEMTRLLSVLAGGAVVLLPMFIVYGSIAWWLKRKDGRNMHGR